MHIKKYMSFGCIGVTTIDQRLRHGNHRCDIFCGARFMVWPQRPKRIHISVIPANGLICQVTNIAPSGSRPRVNLVINVCKIAHIIHMRRSKDLTQQPVQHIKNHHRAGIAQVGTVINRRPTKIEPDMRRINWGEQLVLMGFGICQPNIDHDCPLPCDGPTA